MFGFGEFCEGFAPDKAGKRAISHFSRNILEIL